jgi:hypothetical protein
MTKFINLLTVLGAAGAVLVGTAPAALAGTDATNYYGYQSHGHFYSYGEHVTVYDDYPDGYSGVVEYYRSDTGGHGFLWNGQGAYTSKDFNLGMPEGSTFQFRACIGDGSRGVLIACNGTWSYGIA